MVPHKLDTGLFRPGSVVAIRLPFHKHVGIVTERLVAGKPTVISNSLRTGSIVEEPFDTFADGFEVIHDSYPSQLPSWQVVNRARSRLGDKYSLLSWNCEHLVRLAHGLKPESPQLRAAMVFAGLFLFALKA